LAIEPVGASDIAEVDAFLARRPYENVYLRWIVTCGTLTHHGRSLCYLSRAPQGAIDGVCYFGAQFVLAGENDQALDGFDEVARAAPPARMIVGPREPIERWWERLRRWHRDARVVRARQPVCVLTRETLRGSRTDADVGLATAVELDEIARESAAMIAHETGFDPAINSRDFRERTAQTIGAGWWWRWRVQGTLRFQCSIGAHTPSTAQLQGVWTPPAQREKGYATLALGAICDHLLEQVPSLCLYVNDFNLPALALYDRIGFQPVSEFMTLLF
jgi:RimJ/RimL family protein N-acetyltransferase